MTDATLIADLRRALTEERIILKTATDRVAAARLAAEDACIEAAGGDEKKLGTSDATRARALAACVAKDPAYLEALAAQREHEANVARTETELEVGCDGRRREEWAIRLRLADAIFAARATDAAAPAADGAIDDAAQDAVLTSVADATVNGRPVAVTQSTPGWPEGQPSDLPF